MSRINLPRKLTQKGDTIVEVMLVVAILGLTFAGAYSIATASLAKSRNAQEHTEALQLLNSQVELLRSAEKVTLEQITNGSFCMVNNVPTVRLVQPADPAVCNVSFYTITVVKRAPFNSSGTYMLEASWDGAGGLGRQRERIVYRQHLL